MILLTCLVSELRLNDVLEFLHVQLAGALADVEQTRLVTRVLFPCGLVCSRMSADFHMQMHEKTKCIDGWIGKRTAVVFLVANGGPELIGLQLLILLDRLAPAAPTATKRHVSKHVWCKWVPVEDLSKGEGGLSGELCAVVA